MTEIRSAMPDATLVARVRDRDEVACAELARRHAPLAKRTAVLWGAGDDADDIVQVALVKAMTRLGVRGDDAPFGPWLVRIAINETKNLHRERARRTAREERWTMAMQRLAMTETADPESALVGEERRTALFGALERLPSRSREVITCRFLLGLSVAETAETLQISPGTVKSRLNRGLARMRQEVRDETG